MAEFHINTSVLTVFSTLKTSASGINEGHVEIEKGEITGIDTVEKYCNQDKDIVKLLEKYHQLIDKDLRDLESMVITTNMTDAKLARFLLKLM